MMFHEQFALMFTKWPMSFGFGKYIVL